MSEQVQDNQADKQQEHKKRKQESVQASADVSFTDNRPGSLVQRKLQELADSSPQSQLAIQLQKMADSSPQSQQAIQLQKLADSSPQHLAEKELADLAYSSDQAVEAARLQALANQNGGIYGNVGPVQKKTEEEENPLQAKSKNTGLPDALKAGVESLSGMAMDDVKVNYNSDKPAGVNALAYAQGNEIHIGPGQEKHLAHEAWHVAQQKQGRVGATTQMQGAPVNDDAGLEKEADEMGQKALQMKSSGKLHTARSGNALSNTIQRFEAPGHEAAERTALTSKRSDGREFTNEEASMTYFGNWMRDMNQLMVPAFSEMVGNDGAFALIKVLAMQKFGREINPEQFGFYIPSEHLDNPAGQVKDQDYFGEAPAVSKDLDGTGKDRYNTQDFPARESKYVTPQEGTDPADKVLGANLFDVDHSGVMAYIKRTNIHVERRLELSALKGRTPEGLMHFGAALHAVEDLFSHPNFVEIAVNKVLQENPPVQENGQPGLLPELKGADRRVETLSPKMADGTPILVTGTFTGLDTLHSVGSEGIKMLRQGMKPAATAEEMEAQEALVSACLKKMESLKNNKEVLDKMVGFSGLPEIVVKKFNVSTFYDYARRLPKVVFTVIHNYIMGVVNEKVFTPVANDVEAKLLVTKVQDTPVNIDAKTETDKTVNSKGNNLSPLQEMLEKEAGIKTDRNKNYQNALIKQSAINRTPLNVKAGASHTQLAKDHTNSIFFGLAFKLAVEADKLLRDKMLDVWGNQAKVEDPHMKEAREYRAKEAAKPKPDGFFEEVAAGTMEWFESGPSDNVLLAEARGKKEQESLDFGKQVYRDGKKAGQEYDLEEMRNDSADRILAIAATIRVMATTPSTSKESLEDVKKDLESHGIDGVAIGVLNNSIRTAGNVNQTYLDSNIPKMLLEDAQSFQRIATQVRIAKTLKEREAAQAQLESCKKDFLVDLKIILEQKDPYRYLKGISVGSLIILIDREIAVVAPAYTSQQVTEINGGASKSVIKENNVNLPSLSSVNSLPLDAGKKASIKGLLEMSRKIINHPYQNDWWKPHVKTFMQVHSKQITEEIRARNTGVAHFGGLHNH